MSELMNVTTAGRQNLHWKLLSTVSLGTLIVVLSATGSGALAEANDHPTVWIELGGQLEALQGKEDAYAPAFVINNLDKPYNAVPLTSAQHLPRHAFGGEGKITFEPANTDWVFNAGVRYGRSNSKKTLHQQTQTQFTAKSYKYGQPYYSGKPGLHHGHFTQVVKRFDHSDTRYTEAHAVVDFTAGKDVGLGLFGKGGSSILSVGVRIAQFTRGSNVILRSLPDPYYQTKVVGQVFSSNVRHHHSYYAHELMDRSFRGVGPSISWEGEAPLLGHPDRGEVTLDWGANAAALFGRQKVHGSHETRSLYFGFRSSGIGTAPIEITHTQPINRSRSVVVPNVGGFAGLSVRYPNVKFSVGYRADFFLGAMDGGVDTHHSETQGFNGPFATFSIGLGG